MVKAVPINRENSHVFHRSLYAGQLEEVKLLKRDDDQRQGTVRAVILFDCKWSSIRKAGQTLDGDVDSVHTRRLLIPKVELEAAGVNHLNPLDRFTDEQGRTWQPESTTGIDVKLFENFIACDCLRTGAA